MAELVAVLAEVEAVRVGEISGLTSGVSMGTEMTFEEFTKESVTGVPVPVQ